MKRTILFLLVLLSTSASLFAQTDPTTGGNKPNMGASFVVGLEGGLNSLSFAQGTNPNASGMVGFRYKMASGITARLGVKVNTNNYENDSTAGGVKYTYTDKQTNWGIMIGAHKSFAGTKNLETYLGADLSVMSVGGRKIVDRGEVADATLAGGAVGDYIEDTYTYPKGISFGITPLIGFQYFFVPKLAIGGEFGWGLMTSSIKSGVHTHVTKSGADVTTTTLATDITLKNSGFSSQGQGRILLSVYF